MNVPTSRIVVASRDRAAIREALLEAVRLPPLEAVRERWRGESRATAYAYGTPAEADRAAPGPFTRGRAVRRGRIVKLTVCTAWEDAGAEGWPCSAIELEEVIL